MSKPTFEVSKEGLRKILREREHGIARAIIELVQNAFDEDVTEVRVSMVPVPNSPKVEITVRDDSPEGFRDLSHAYTLFAESWKKEKPNKRGRFNLGEKLVIAICEKARIVSTTGAVEFIGTERRSLRRRTEQGSFFYGLLKITREEMDDAKRLLHTVLVPKGVKLFFNDVVIPYRKPVGETVGTLQTLISREGLLVPSYRRTTLEFYTPLSGEKPMIYEMGLPIREITSRWHINVGQKVPLPFDRDNIPPAYAREVMGLMLNAMNDKLTKEDRGTEYFKQGTASSTITDDAYEQSMERVFGERRVTQDPSDPEGTKIAVSEGYTVVHPSELDRRAHERNRKLGAILPAGRVTPSPRPYSDDPNAPIRKELPPEKWTDGIRTVVEVTKVLAEELLGTSIEIRIVNDLDVGASATFRPSGVSSGPLFEYNVARLGYAWFDRHPMHEDILTLVIHEFGHFYSLDHLSGEYYKALCKVGARLAHYAAKHPTQFIEGTIA